LGRASFHCSTQVAAREKGLKLKNESSYRVSWRPRALHEPQTSTRVWVILGFFAVAIMGIAIIVDTNAAVTIHVAP
jgi:hypothetical protein